MAMPGRIYPEPAAAPGSLSMPGGIISGYNSNSELLTNAADNFTIELWVKPTETHQIDIEGYWFNQYGGTSGQKYVIDPAHAMYFGNSTDESGAGVSVGTNGVSVYEHSGGYMPPMLVWQGNVTEWTHVAVVYENKTPRLYINGELVRTGVTSPKIHVYPGTLLASGSYGSMAGQVDEVRIWKVVRTQQQIQDGMYHSVSSPQPNLEAYWPIQPDETTTVADQSGNNHNVTLPTANYTSSSNTAPVGTDGYRYGFNGQEKSDEIKGSGNSYTAEFWEYDPRLGRRWNVDPVINPSQSSYTALSNNPIIQVDPLGNVDTTVTVAGGRNNVTIDNATNSLSFYTEANYKITGTQTFVPVQAGQLRSFSNAVGTFNANWLTDANGAAVFAGYRNNRGMDLEAVVKELQDLKSNWKYQLFSFGDHMNKAHDKDPMGFNLKLTFGLISMSAMEAVQPSFGSFGYNPSITTQESMSALGTLRFAPKANELGFGLGTHLNEFSEALNLLNYRQFTSGGFKPNEIRAAIQDPANTLNFNLQGFTRWRYLKYANNPVSPSPALNNITNWELHIIYNTPGALQRTRFYNFTNGGYQIVKPPFLP